MSLRFPIVSDDVHISNRYSKRYTTVLTEMFDHSKKDRTHVSN